MRYLTKTLDFDSRGDSVVTLGKFDGLHRGHMLLIRRVLAIGRTEGPVSYTHLTLPTTSRV